MKTFFRTALVLLLATLMADASAAIKVGDLYYIITSSNPPAVSVYYKTDQYGFQIKYNLSGSITIPETITYNGTVYSVVGINDDTFCECNGLTSISIPNSVTYIGESAFECCTGLRSITIPNSVTSIGDRAFIGCSSLTSVSIGSSVSSIGDGSNMYYPVRCTNPFFNCPNLTSITVDPSNATFDSRNNCNAIIETASNTLVTGCKNTSIPATVTSIGLEAFLGQSGLTSITIPNSVTFIDDAAFKQTGLKSITIPNSVTAFGRLWYDISMGGGGVFEGCQSLTDVSIGENVKTIGSYAFESCDNLKNITIPEGVETVGWVALSASNLTNVVWNAIDCSTKTDAFGNGVFLGCSSIRSFIFGNKVERIPAQLMANSYASGLTDITIPNSVKYIGGSAFAWCEGLLNIHFGNSIEFVGARAFSGTPWLASQGNGMIYIGKIAYLYNGEVPENTTVDIKDGTVAISPFCFESQSRLTSVNIPNTVKTIGNDAFYYCTGLTSISIPDAVQTIPSSCFYHCSNLSKITIGKSLTTIEDYAFTECRNVKELTWNAVNGPRLPITKSNIEKVTIGNAVEVLPESFVYSSKITSVVIPNSVKAISEYAFYECSALKSVSIGNSVEVINECAFGNCSALTSISIPNSVVSIGKSVFSYCTSLSNVTIGNSCASIAEYCFNNCKSLNTIYSKRTTPPSLKSNTFYSVDKSKCRLYVPQDSYVSYRSATYWKDFSFINKIESDQGDIYSAVEDFETMPVTDDKNRTYVAGSISTWTFSNANVTSTNSQAGTGANMCAIYKSGSVKMTNPLRENVLNVAASIYNSSTSTTAKFDIYTSTDGNAWTKLNATSYELTKKSKGTFSVVCNPPMKNTYFRIVMSAGSTTEPSYIDDLSFDYFEHLVTGDVNSDGTVDIDDLNLVVNAILSLTDNPNADVSGDGKVDIEDLNIVINYILNH